MITVAESIAAIAARRAETLSPWDREDIAMILEAAAEWDAGTMPLTELAKLGTIISPASGNPSAAYSRYIAMLTADLLDSRRFALKKAIDALVRFQGFVVTAQGVFSPADIPDVVIRREPS